MSDNETVLSAAQQIAVAWFKHAADDDGACEIPEVECLASFIAPYLQAAKLEAAEKMREACASVESPYLGEQGRIKLQRDIRALPVPAPADALERIVEEAFEAGRSFGFRYQVFIESTSPTAKEPVKPTARALLDEIALRIAKGE